jgi:hypothetical protein
MQDSDFLETVQNPVDENGFGGSRMWGNRLSNRRVRGLYK